MITFFFRLETSKTLKDKTHPIYLSFKITEGKTLKWYRHYTGKSATKKQWIGKGNKKRVSATATGAGVINSRLEYLYSGAAAIITNANNLKHNITIDYIKSRFELEVLGRLPKPEPEPVKISFFEHLQNFIDSKKNIFQPATIKTYSTLKKSLQDFEAASDYKIEFDSVNQLFITLYTKYLIEDTGVINNTLAKRVATLKAFLAEMKKLKINSCTDFESFEASRNYETTIMYLTEKELLQLQNLEVQPDTTEAHVKDAFCFACHTGIRFSDWNNLTPDNILLMNHEGRIVQAIKFTMFKVHKEVTVPLNEYALSIIDKYKGYAATHGKLFPVYTNQETNRTLKDLAKEAKINDVIIEVKKSGANRKTYTNAKHEILTCHDARNTMATLYLENGGRPEVLKKLLGHSDIKQTMRYVKITEKAVIDDYIKMTDNTNKVKVVEMKKPA
ncbi:MAG TPA: tyrosine-type recombinase/integrase [Chitinophagaceae bacterium]|jgi:integrase|nr:tyrosine-type recombinase/integrase [Chitinophagaceae bacterium]